MASTDFNTSTVSAAQSRFATVLDNLRVRFDQYRVYRQTKQELLNLSDRELADLGLNRSMIQSIATEAAYGK